MRFSNIILDVNNLFWRNVSISIKEKIVSEQDEVYSYTIQMTINKINSLIAEYGQYKDCKVYLCFDNPLSKIGTRKEIDPMYKHSRERKFVPPAFHKTLQIFAELVEVYSDNFYICRVDSLEADDLVQPLLKYLNYNNCLLISADLDWARSIENNIDTTVSWYNYHTLYDLDSFKTKYGFFPNNNSITLYKSLRGDNSDNIPNGCPGLREEIVLDICNRFNSDDELFKNLFNTDYPQQWKLKLKENELRIRTNYALVDFIQVDGSIEDHIVQCKESIKALKAWFRLLEIPLEYRMKDEKDIKQQKENFFKINYPKR